MVAVHFRMNWPCFSITSCFLLLIGGFFSCQSPTGHYHESPIALIPDARLMPSKKFVFNSFVDCNMATVWINDSFRIFPGKYGEDPLWGNSHELKYSSGVTVDDAFGKDARQFKEPAMPANMQPGVPGLHGAVWFETLYKDPTDRSGKTLFALYHNENYPSTLPYDSATGTGYQDLNWPLGLRGPATKTAVCRIGIMKSTDAGKSWTDKGVLLEDYQKRLILQPHNQAINFAGGVGDPSAVANGDYLYIFYGEYGYPGNYSSNAYDAVFEWQGQCISVARILLKDLDHPNKKARRWNGKEFIAPSDSVGRPVVHLQIPRAEGGGPASSPKAKYFWGPAVSWNNDLKCWVMLMAKAEGPSWKGNSIYVSFNLNANLGDSGKSQQWSIPALLVQKPGHILWYPSLQPLNSEGDRANKYTSVKLGARARLFYKDNSGNSSEYISEYLVEFIKKPG